MSWDQLIAYGQEAARTRQQEANEPPVACPFHGVPLDINARGVRNCPDGDYTWRGGPPPDPPK